MADEEPNPGNGRVTIREVYDLVSKVEEKIDTSNNLMRQYIDLRINEQDKRVEQTRKETQRRLDDVTVTVERLNLEGQTFLSEEKYEVRHEALRERHAADMKAIQERLEGCMSGVEERFNHINDRLNNLTWKVLGVAAPTAILTTLVIVILSGHLKFN